jgi:hypothetical protein
MLLFSYFTCWLECERQERPPFGSLFAFFSTVNSEAKPIYPCSGLPPCFLSVRISILLIFQQQSEISRMRMLTERKQRAEKHRQVLSTCKPRYQSLGLLLRWGDEDSFQIAYNGQFSEITIGWPQFPSVFEGFHHRFWLGRKIQTEAYRPTGRN